MTYLIERMALNSWRAVFTVGHFPEHKPFFSNIFRIFQVIFYYSTGICASRIAILKMSRHYLPSALSAETERIETLRDRRKIWLVQHDYSQNKTVNQHGKPRKVQFLRLNDCQNIPVASFSISFSFEHDIFSINYPEVSWRAILQKAHAKTA